MKTANRRPTLLTLSLVLALVTVAGVARAEDSAADRLFTVHVLPLLKAKCLGCHGGDPRDIKGELSVASRDKLLTGGESGEPAIVAGKPDASLLYQAIRWDGLEMPPKENDRLTPREIARVRQWIAAGAPWPGEEAQRRILRAEATVGENADGVLVATSGGLSDQWTYRRYQAEDLWAFRPVSPPAVPPGAHPIDYFVGRRLQAEGVVPAPRADWLTLLRRATFDLLGLPPAPAEIAEFREAWRRDSDQAWTQLIDRLLASPHYGERSAQHWLDVARYADTGGYSNDYERSNIWRYRDYVIRAFNQDKPYDQFVIEQLAGDHLWEQQPPPARDASLLIATGFLRLGPWDPAMVKAPEARQVYVDDVVNAVGQTFLSTTLRCVKCHDHKFDPIPTRDYYRIYAAFADTQLAERAAPFLPEENLAGFEAGRAHVQQLEEFAKQRKDRLHAKREAAAKLWFREHDLPYADAEQRKQLPDAKKPPRHYGLDHVDEGRLKVREQDEWIWNRRLERYQPLAQSVYSGPDPGFLNARKLRMPAKPPQAAERVNSIYLGGSLEAPGDRVFPGVLSATAVAATAMSGATATSGATSAATAADSSETSPGGQGSGRQGSGREEDPYLLDPAIPERLAFARWVADPANPLTSRSLVNRLWQQHFVHGLAGNANNFGAKGARPTHPGLLDWLAHDFVSHGWQLKRIHKLIMTSRTYQQASHHPDRKKLAVEDPDNRLLAYFPARRLSAEELRDALLHVTGELNPALGGLPVFPEINQEVALQPRMIQFSLAPAYQPSRTPEERNRRTIYAYRVRGQADPFLEVFNQPNPNESCESRDAAAVSPQAFSLMNSDVMNDRAIALAIRLRREAKSLTEQIEHAFVLALGRAPTAAEQTRLAAYVRRMESYHRDHQPEPVTYPRRITRSLVEEFSGRPFQYEEILPVFEDYVADAKAADVSPATRALADFCLVLLNSHEFVYVY